MDYTFVYQKSEIKKIRQGGKILAKILIQLKRKVKPGVTTRDLVNYAEKLFQDSPGVASFKGYNGYPDAICVSVNEEVVHTAGSERQVKEGDIVGLDLGFKYLGYHSDLAETVMVGRTEGLAKKLTKAAKIALKKAIKAVRPGILLSKIGRIVEEVAKEKGFSVVKELSGHGIGRELHEEPTIPNFYQEDKETVFKKGMVVAIEPILSAGSGKIVDLKEEHKIVTEDGALSSHFEHTIAVLEKGAEVLTKT